MLNMPFHPPAPHLLTPSPVPAHALVQSTTLKTWSGKRENWDKAQAILVALAKANSEAQRGTYKVGGGLRGAHAWGWDEIWLWLWQLAWWAQDKGGAGTDGAGKEICPYCSGQHKENC